MFSCRKSCCVSLMKHKLKIILLLIMNGLQCIARFLFIVMTSWRPANLHNCLIKHFSDHSIIF